MKIFFDCEFTGLHQSTTLISLGCVAENGWTFYAEFSDYDRKQVDAWIKENVISSLRWNNVADFHHDILQTKAFEVKGEKQSIGEKLKIWLLASACADSSPPQPAETLEFWGDCLAYDWVLFCELFGGAMKLPDWINYIPHHICTLFKLKGIDPDISREDFIGREKVMEFAEVTNTPQLLGEDLKHNALFDAQVIKACYDKLMSME